MNSSITKLALQGNDAKQKQEQNVVCSNTLKINQASTQRVGTGVAKQLMLLWLLVFTLVGGTALGQRTNTYTTGTNVTHTVPEEVEYVIIEAIGGGGAGGAVTNNGSNNGSRPAGGGGGGAYSKIQIPVLKIKNRTLTYTVGSGGTSAAGDGKNTTVRFTYIKEDNTEVACTLTANGGKGAAAVTNSTVGSGASGGAKSVLSGGISGEVLSSYRSYAGGNGANGVFEDDNNFSSGGGGGAAGSNGPGYDAVRGSGGSVQLPGGNGANGTYATNQNTYADGRSGTNYGGGGSGACRRTSGNNTGGNGATGAVIITEYNSRSSCVANPDIISRGSNIDSMKIDVVANDFVPGEGYTITIVGGSVNYGTATVTNDKKVLFTFPTNGYNSNNSSFQYSITYGSSTSTATVVIQNSTVVANLGCPAKPTTDKNYYDFPDAEIIGDGSAKIQYMSLAFTNVPNIENVAGYSFTVSSDSKFEINSNGIYYKENETNTKIGDTINFGKFMLACHFNENGGIAMSLAKALIAAIQVSIPTGLTDFVGVELEITTNHGDRNIIYNAENGHYYELKKGTVY